MAAGLRLQQRRCDSAKKAGFGCGIRASVGHNVTDMANAATTKAARRAARQAAVAAQEELARRTRADMEDLTVFFSARERAESVDVGLAERVAVTLVSLITCPVAT
jgi:hypothetical protein